MSEEFWKANPQMLNALSRETQELTKLLDSAFKLKQIRSQIESLGVMQVPSGEYPPPGDLSHLTAQKVASVLAAMDVLDTAFLTPTNLAGVTLTPIAAINQVIR